jgi:RNA polymerase sigma-70 factor (ECF subfamily)
MATSMTERAALHGLAAPARVCAPVHEQPLKTRDVFRAEAGFVLRLVRSLGVPAGDAEDVAQEVFVVVHRQLETLKDPARLRSWLFGIVRRVVANYRRRAHRRHEQLTDEIELLGTPSEQPATSENTRERALLDRALDKLDPLKREVFVLFELEGVAMRDVAAMTNSPLFTAYSRLYAARRIVSRAILSAAGKKPRQA